MTPAQPNTPRSDSPLELLAPLSGVLVPLAQVPDPVFAGKLAGDGIALDPTSSTLLAPAAGTVTILHPSYHALTLTTDSGAPILLHVGLDTVRLRGAGFRALVKAGDRVAQGQPLIEFDIDAVARAARSLLTQILVADTSHIFAVSAELGLVEAGKSRVLTVSRTADEPRSSRTDDTPEQSERITGRPVLLPNLIGLHARPGAVLAAKAGEFRGDIRLASGEREANAKSLVSILGLGTRRGDSVSVRAVGPDALAAVEALTRLLESGCGERADAIVVSEAPKTAPCRAREPEGGVISGVPAAPGLAVGRVFHFKRKPAAVPETGGAENDERGRLLRALDDARREIDTLRAALTAPEHAGILGAHLAMLNDPELLDPAHAGIREGKSAAYAWQNAYTRHAARLESQENPALRERAGDIRDVGGRVLRLLSGARHDPIDAPAGSILIAEELTPSDTASIDRTKILGFCTVGGGATGHVAILARAFGLPAVCGAHPSATNLAEGASVVLDGHSGTLLTNPSEEELLLARNRMTEQRRVRACDSAPDFDRALTVDGARIEVVANVRNASEAREAAEIGADGVGLLRTEFLFDGRDSEPTENEQAEAYSACAKALGPCRPLVIRTLDAGGDKPLPFLPGPHETNPALGLRGIRTGLANPELLRTQLRAILRAAAHGDVRVMFPMVATAEEFRQAHAMLDEESRKLGVRVKAGVMIEVPSAALIAEHLAGESDFLSLGTNDLTQYTLAMDREHPTLSLRADALSPAVLRLIEMTARAAQRQDMPLAACGALAADTSATPLLIGLGVRELSVPVPDVPRIKAVVKRLLLADCRELARKALECDGADAVRKLLSESPAGADTPQA